MPGLMPDFWVGMVVLTFSLDTRVIMCDGIEIMGQLSVFLTSLLILQSPILPPPPFYFTI